MTTSTPTTKILAIGTINPGVTGPPHELRTDSYWPAQSASSVAGHESKPLAWQSGGPCGSLEPGQKRRMSVTGHNGHRKPLYLRLRGSGFNDGDQSNQNEDGQHSGLRDREGWFGLHRSQRIESRNLDEALHNQNEDVKIKRHNSGDYVDPAPCAYQVLFVQSKQRDSQDHTSHNSDAQCRREAMDGKKKSSQAGERRCKEKNCGGDRQPIRSKHPAYNDQPTSDCDKGDNDVQDCEGIHRHP